MVNALKEVLRLPLEALESGSHEKTLELLCEILVSSNRNQNIYNSSFHSAVRKAVSDVLKIREVPLAELFWEKIV